MTGKILNTRSTVAVLALFLLAAGWEAGFLNGVSAQNTNDNKRPRTTVSPTPAPSPKTTTTPSGQSLADLQAKIRAILQRQPLQRGQIGVKIVSLDSGKVMFEENAEKYFMPASNMKNFTVAAAMTRLSPEHRFITSVYAAAKPDDSGLVKGDLVIYGRGDPSIAASFNNGDYYKGMDALADKIVQAGVKRIEGGLVGDESYFTSEPIPYTWEWDDLQWYYGAEVSALTVNDNSLDVNVVPGSSVGSFANITLAPTLPGIKIVNKVTTVAAGTSKQTSVHRPLSENLFEISGRIAVNDPGTIANFGSVAVVKPANMFVALLRQRLELKGVTITGANRVVSDTKISSVASSTPWVEIAKLESHPLGLIAAKTMKPSQNLYTELILRSMGELRSNKTDSKNSQQRGVAEVNSFLKEAGVPDGSVIMYDGSGLSRHNLITPNALIQVHTFMNKSRYAQAWRDALPVGGVDGTLKTRLKDPATANNVRAKTGTIDQVSALSGFVNSAGSERLVFAVIVNGVMSQSYRQDAIDDIVKLLATFNGKTN